MSIVIDTNIVLDLLVFDDPASAALAAALDSGELHWISCTPMRDELARVLGYPIIAAHLERRARHVDEVLAAHDARVREVLPLAARAPCVCRDPDDQVFIDLAVAHRARLLSKDRAVLALRRRLQAWGVQGSASWSTGLPAR